MSDRFGTTHSGKAGVDWKLAQCDTKCNKYCIPISQAIAGVHARAREFWKANNCSTVPSNITDMGSFRMGNCQCQLDQHEGGSDVWVGYVKYIFGGLHGETFYTWVHYMCGGAGVRVSHPWPLPPAVRRRVVYVGPAKWANESGRREVWGLVNSTSCRVYFGQPESPDLTVETTWGTSSLHSASAALVNNPAYVLICHTPQTCMSTVKRKRLMAAESATNVYALTPANPRWILPDVFPAAAVATRRRRGDTPVFLVLGGVEGGKRNWASLDSVLAAHGHRRFVLRILNRDKKLPGALAPFKSRIEHFAIEDDYAFMANLSDVYAVLPLVDEKNFFIYNNGAKLTSSVSWGLGFNTTFVAWQGLDAVYGLSERRPGRVFAYERGVKAFIEAFGRALDAFDKGLW